jgi:hypothetical protein
MARGFLAFLDTVSRQPEASDLKMVVVLPT